MEACDNQDEKSTRIFHQCFRPEGVALVWTVLSLMGTALDGRDCLGNMLCRAMPAICLMYRLHSIAQNSIAHSRARQHRGIGAGWRWVQGKGKL